MVGHRIHEASAPPLGRVPAIDGFRGMACLLVVGFHSGVVVGGSIGIDLFFVLSGYLVASVLLDEQRRTGTIAVGRFYLRRAIRLLPALYLFVAVALACTAFFPRSALFGQLSLWAPLAVLSFVSVAHVGQNVGIVQPIWSLSIEEQFYAVWPLAIILLCRTGLRGRKCALPFVGLAVASMAMRSALFANTSEPFRESRQFYREYVAADAWAFAILLGCALPFVVEDWRPRRSVRSALELVSICAAALLAYVATSYDYAREHTIVFAVPLCALAILTAMRQPYSWTSCLAARPLVWIGKRSYSIYLWHVAAFAMVDPEVAGDPYVHPPSPMTLATMLGLALVLGVLSYAIAEEALMRWSATSKQRALPAPAASAIYSGFVP